MLDRTDPNQTSDLSDRLWADLRELAGGMGRESESAGVAVGYLCDLIREWLAAWAMAGGVSPTEAGQHVIFTAAPWPIAEEGAA